MENSYEGKIAIVGMACRLPGAGNTRQYWSNLVNEVESLTTFTDEELLAAGVEPEIMKSENYVRKRGIIGGADMFDAEFFGFTPREAELLDPQHRAFLECAWHALEDAGIDPAASPHLKIGVFGGTGSPFHLADTLEHPAVKKFSSGASIITSNDKDYCTTRVSYKLNLTGPSINVQSACSTSLLAVVLGMDSLNSYQCDVILAGAATVELPERKGYIYQAGGMESADGVCRTFDKDASGTVFSRGSGMVALKRLEDAIADGDHIYSVLLGGAINNDGNKKAGYTAPSVDGQVEVITEALEITDVSPETISYVEAHGTATPIGDPIEVSSLTKAFAAHTDRKQYCALGSVKTNIGHTDSASGMASLIKVALSLENKILPASLHFNSPNPKIDFPSSPFFVNTKTKKWENNGDTPLRALINSFGVGGTNVCVIVEEPPRLVQAPSTVKKDILLLSARNEKAMEAYANNISAFLKDNPETDLAGLAHTSRTGRKPFDVKSYVPFSGAADLISSLEKIKITETKDHSRRNVVFMFPGQGNQYVNMGRALYDESPVFREAVDKCATILHAELKTDIRQVIYPSAAQMPKAMELINETYITQPALFIISYATAQLWLSFGIEPGSMIGHSVGEYVAACVSGVLSLEDALHAVARRGKLIHDLPGGSMLAVLMPEKDLISILPQGLEIAVVNSPELCVISGSTDSINAFSAQLKEKKVFSKVIPTSHAFHSHMMDACLPEFAAFFRKIKLNAPTIPIISSVTGKPLTDKEATDPAYWVDHVRKAVRFGDAAAYAIAGEPAIFLESGPGQSLESAIKRQLPKENAHYTIGSILPAENNTQDAMVNLFNAFGNFWAAGKPINWGAWFPKRNIVSYPGYPFQRKSFQIDFTQKLKPVAETKNMKKADPKDWFYTPSWKRTPYVDLISSELIGKPDDQRIWVVFAEHHLSDAIINQLKEDEETFFIVRKGTSYTKTGNEFTINPNDKADYVKFAEQLKIDNTPLHIIHGWNLIGKERSEISYEQASKFISIFDGLLYLEQALINKNLIKDISLIVLVDGVFDVMGEGVIHPENALALGPVRVLYKEHLLQMTTRLIDLRLPDSAIQLKHLANNIIKEATFTTDENVVAYRHGIRWTESYEQVFLQDNESYKGVFKDGGVYLITGGSGGIGQVLSNLVADTVSATFVIINRTPLPSRSNWESLLAKPEHSTPKIIERIRFVLEMEAKGANIFMAQGNVNDLESMGKAVKEAEEKYGPINGVVHSAGISGGGVISLQEKKSTDEVLSPKVHGTLALHELFKEKPLDFFYVFSSIGSMLAEAGRVDYCSGNSFLDAYAQYEYNHRKAPGLVTSINWGQWGLIGMAADYQRQKVERNKQYKYMLSEGENRGIALTPIDGDGKDMYLVNMDPEKDWVMCAHLITEMPTLVGTAYIGFLHTWAKMLNMPGYVTLKDIKFTSPFIMNPQQEKELILVIDEQSTDSCKFRFRSRVKTSGSKASFWLDHASGELIMINEPAPALIDRQALIAKHNVGVTETGHYLSLFNNMIQFGGRWDCRRKMYVGKDEWFVELELKTEYSGDFDQYYVHPSILDVASCTHLAVMENIGARLPYSYKECKIFRPMEREVYSYVRSSKPFTSEDEFFTFDVDIFNAKGEVLVRLTEYTFIKVEQTKQVSEKKPTASVVALENDILPEEGVEVFKLLLSAENIPQLVVLTVDMSIEFTESMIFFKRKDSEKKVVEVKEEGYERPELDTPFEEAENEIEKSIAAIWKGILGIGKIGVNDSFNALGGNSLLAIQTISNIADEFDIELQANDFFENATIRGLAQVIVNKIIMMSADVDLENALSEL